MQFQVLTDRPRVGAYWGTRKLSNNNPQSWLGRAFPLSLDCKRQKPILSLQMINQFFESFL